ncbi:MAG: hypothetical protein J7559_06485, partial [Cohnella sp.]|nr:hypothetical protein [Cohnella sp.]
VDRVVAIRDGMTSTEWVKREEKQTREAEAGSKFGDRHAEYVVIDRAGRLQIPKAYLDAMNVDGKAVLEFDGRRVTLLSPDDPGGERDGHEAGSGEAG